MTTTRPAFDPVAVAAALDAFTEAYRPEPPKKLTIEQKLSDPKIRSAVASARDKGMSFQQIADALAVNGLKMSKDTLRLYWSRIRATPEETTAPEKAIRTFQPPQASNPAIRKLSEALREPYDALFDDDRQEMDMTPERLAANAVVATFSGRIDSHHCPFMDMEDGRGEFIDEVANIIKHAFDPQSRQEAAALASVHW